MSDEHQTGNPVFDYRSGYRKSAAEIQRVMIRLGLLQLFVGAAIYAYNRRPVMAYFGIMGMVLLLAGVVYGFYWRRKIRNEFRIEFGNDAKT
jgi:hypothetical protein